MTTKESYGNYSRGIPIIIVLFNFLRKFKVSNKKIHRALRTRTTLMNNTHQRNFSFSPFTKTILGLKTFHYMIIIIGFVKLCEVMYFINPFLPGTWYTRFPQGLLTDGNRVYPVPEMLNGMTTLGAQIHIYLPCTRCENIIDRKVKVFHIYTCS